MYDNKINSGLFEASNKIYSYSINQSTSRDKYYLACQQTSMLKLGCRPRNFSLTVVIILAISNMLLTFLLLQSETCTSSSSLNNKNDILINNNNNNNNDNKLTTKKIDKVQKYDDYNDNPSTINFNDHIDDDDDNNDELIDNINININLGKWDNQRIIKMYDSVLIGSKFIELSKNSKICLATQSSIEKLHSLVQVSHHWTSSISVAIYIAGDEEYNAVNKYLIYLRYCYKSIRERINFSLAIPFNNIPINKLNIINNLNNIKNLNCSLPEMTLNNIINNISLKHKSWKSKNSYPQNHMRNLARKNCQSDYLFLTDIDIIPSIGFSESINIFLHNIPDNNCDKCAFVVPTYELDKRVKFPLNKTELVRLAKKGLARPFHWKVFIHNQYATNFSRWIMDVIPGSKGYNNILNEKTYVCHNVTNFEFLYEPFYVAKDTAPPHDERFIGYGYTRNTQVYEMYVAGYQFQILSPLFTVHWGLQTRKGRLPWRERQNIINRKKFDQFKREIFTKYERDVSKPLKKL